MLNNGIIKPWINIKMKYYLQIAANNIIGIIEKTYAAAIPRKKLTTSSFIKNAITVSPKTIAAHVTADARTQIAGK